MGPQSIETICIPHFGVIKGSASSTEGHSPPLGRGKQSVTCESSGPPIPAVSGAVPVFTQAGAPPPPSALGPGIALRAPHPEPSNIAIARPPRPRSRTRARGRGRADRVGTRAIYHRISVDGGRSPRAASVPVRSVPVLALVLACVLLVTLRWAVNVTNANARQVSTNLNALRDRIDEPLSTADPSRSAHVHKPRAALAADGPTIEPVDDR